MTPFQAIVGLERKVHQLHIKFKDGVFMDDIIAMGKIGNYHGKRYDDVLEAFAQDKISIDQYYMDMMKMIVEYGSRDRDPGPWIDQKPFAPSGSMF